MPKSGRRAPGARVSRLRAGTVRLAVAAAVLGGICMAAGLFVSVVVADHSSSDSSGSSITAILLIALGLLAVLAAVAVFGCIALARGAALLWQRLARGRRQ
jgi:small-conductance mechanosensitive channel